MRIGTIRRISIASLAALVLAGPSGARPPALVFAYDLTYGRLIRFFADAPGIVVGDVALTGLDASWYLLGIDFRPLDGGLYGFASDGRIARVVSIDTTTGVVTPIGPGDVAPPGTFAGVDFNSTVDRIRLVTDADSNQRWNPNTGSTPLVDTSLVYDAGDVAFGADPNVVHLAYLNHGPSNPTTVYGIDTNLDDLVRLGTPNGTPLSPNTGLLFTIGALGVGASDIGGFDVEWQSDRAFALLRAGAVQSLYAIDLATGAATKIGDTDPNRLLDGLAVPEPGALGAGAIAIAALATGSARSSRRRVPSC